MSVRGKYNGPVVPPKPPKPPPLPPRQQPVSINKSRKKPALVGRRNIPSSTNSSDLGGASRARSREGVAFSRAQSSPCFHSEESIYGNLQTARGMYQINCTNGHGSLRITSKDSGVTSGEEEHTFSRFARDVTDPNTATPLRIYGKRGSVRGYKDRVRAGIAVLTEQSEGNKNYRDLEEGKVVLFTTSVQIIRNTFERCKRARHILQTHMVEFEERDVFLSAVNQADLKERMRDDKVIVPQVFADGQHMGSLKELEDLNESGQLRKIFSQFKRISHPTSCDSCGGYKYIPCVSCHGSKKSLRRNNFTNEFCALRCVTCDENGLVRCDKCRNQQKS